MSNEKKQPISTQKDSNVAVDKIRDILFGSQMDSYEQHFQRLEEMIVAEVRKSADGVNTQLKTLETSINQRIEKTEQTLELEKKQRVEAFNTVNTAQQQSFQQLQDQLQKLEHVSSTDMESIKVSIEQQVQSLSSQTLSLRDELSQSLNDETRRLDKETVNRQQLADMLAKLSQQLNESK